MSGYQLAQLNIATLLAPLDSPQLKDFVDNLDRINALAEGSDGFVWRWDESYDLDGDAAANGSDAKAPAHPFGDNVIVNMSVWRDVEALQAFAFRSDHVEIVRRRREWFAKMDQAYMVLWWVPQGHQPTPDEAAKRLALLRERGPSADAFTFRETLPSPTDKSQAMPNEIILDRHCGRETFPITSATWNVAVDDELGEPALCVRVEAASGPTINPYDADEVFHAQPHWEITVRAPGLGDAPPTQGQRFELASGCDDETDGYVTNFYYFSHEQSDANVIEVLEVDGRRLRLRLAGQRYDSSAKNTPINLRVETWFEHDPQTERSSS